MHEIGLFIQMHSFLPPHDTTLSTVVVLVGVACAVFIGVVFCTNITILLSMFSAQILGNFLKNLDLQFYELVHIVVSHLNIKLLCLNHLLVKVRQVIYYYLLRIQFPRDFVSALVIFAGAMV